MSDDSGDDQHATTPPIDLPGGATGQIWWDGGTDPHGTVYPDGHIEGGISGGVTVTIPFGGSSSAGHPSSNPAPGPLDDPVSQSILRARAQQGIDDGLPTPSAAPPEEMGDYPTPNDYGGDPGQDGTDDSTGSDDTYA